MKVRYRLVYCRKGCFRGDGRALIQVEASQGCVKKYFSSGVYVLPGQWNNKKRAVVNHPNANLLNAYLFEMIINLERTELELWKRGVEPTLNLIKENFRKAGEPSVSFKDFCNSAIMESSRCTSTKKNLISTLNCLTKFRLGYTWVDINYSFVHQFELWMVRNGFAKNTVIKHLRNLRTLINEAIVMGHIRPENNPFKVFKISQHKSQHKFLYPHELKCIENICVTGRLLHTKDAFLFCCYTGLRFSDFCRLNDEFFHVEKGCMWLKMKLKKTGIEIALPLTLLFNGKAEEIMKRYRSITAFAKIGSNSKVNSDLKAIQKIVGIKTKITFHVARHTCATLLCHQGIPITTVQKILGHTKVSTTQIYQEVMSETMVNDLKKAFC